MAAYSYQDQGGDIVIIALKCEKATTITPDGIARSGNLITLFFSNDLTSTQKTALDTTMASSTVGQIPSSANTIYTWSDLMDARAALRTQSGLNFDIYPQDGSTYKIIFDHVLTTQQRNSFANAVLTFLKQIQ